VLNDRDMRATIDRVLDANRPRGGSRAARLAAAVGVSGKFITGCLVVEYGAPAYGIEEDAAIVDAEGSDAFDAGSAVLYGVDIDGGSGG
jgi:hypothetical protein